MHVTRRGVLHGELTGSAQRAHTHFYFRTQISDWNSNFKHIRFVVVSAATRFLHRPRWRFQKMSGQIHKSAFKRNQATLYRCLNLDLGLTFNTLFKKNNNNNLGLHLPMWLHKSGIMQQPVYSALGRKFLNTIPWFDISNWKSFKAHKQLAVEWTVIGGLLLLLRLKGEKI